MLKKSARLGRAAFSEYFNKGKRTHGLYSTVIYSPAPEFLCSVVVGKKVSKKAPVRNTLRRRAYALVETLVKEKNLNGACIVIVKPEAMKLSRKAFAEALLVEVGRVLN